MCSVIDDKLIQTARSTSLTSLLIQFMHHLAEFQFLSGFEALDTLKPVIPRIITRFVYISR